VSKVTDPGKPSTLVEYIDGFCATTVSILNSLADCG
jgi:hypothetical protein